MQAEQDIITPHITDARYIRYPCFKPGFDCELQLPQWAPLRIGPLTLDISPTKHVVMLWIAALLVTITLLIAARAHRRQHAAGGAPKGFANGIEALVLYIRQEVVLPNVGRHGEKYAPFILTLFFLILFANLLGLIPYGATATGNISVTATLAFITFITVEAAGIRTLGPGYLRTIVYWPQDMPVALKAPLTLLMTPIELASKFLKPITLAIRLFANMTAGHIIVLALVGLIFSFRSYAIAPVPVLMALAIMVLEVFISFLQAYVFALLASVYIGLIREGAH